MKVFPADAHGSNVSLAAASHPEAALSFDQVYERWFDDVVRWVRALGGTGSELEDLAQEVFLIVQRKLPEFDGTNLGGWLFTIARRTTRDHRRLAYVRNIFMRSRDVELEAVQDNRSNPAEILEKKADQNLLFAWVNSLSEKRRTAFVLFEIEGYSGEEIAALEGIPVATVWTRLHHARHELMQKAKTFTDEER